MKADHRIYHTVNNRLQVFGRYNEAPSENRTRDSDAPSALSRTTLDTGTVTVGGAFSINSNVSGDFRLNYSKTRYHNFFTLDSFGGAVPPAESQIFPAFASQENSQIGFGMNISGSHAGLKIGENGVNLQRQFNLVNTFSISTGTHQLKAGVDYRRLSPSYTPPVYTQEGAFQNLSQLEAGRAAWVILRAWEKAEPLFTNFSAFWQDAWKAGRRLTLTYGMRWEVNPAPFASAWSIKSHKSGISKPFFGEASASSMISAPERRRPDSAAAGRFRCRIRRSLWNLQARGRRL
ncbi:MAG: TonB-dependent receptor domain-containing protein [Blastocatellia bacterium]